MYEPIWLDGRLSKAEFRDSLEQNTTALVDEADEIHEDWLTKRFARQSAQMSVKRARKTGWKSEPLNLFGATALHRRKPFGDPAVLSRSIVVMTKRSLVVPFDAASFEAHAEQVRDVAAKISWQEVPESAGDRIADTWEPLRVVARHLGDESWLGFADEQMGRARANLSLGQEEEPRQVVFRTFLALTLEVGEFGEEELRDRVALADITKALPDDQKQNSWAVGDILRDLGFETGTTGGTQYVHYGDVEKLVEAGRALGLEDEWLDKQDEQEAAD